MDMNDVYLVVVRLNGWEFMASASHVNAKKAVRGLAADLQDFYEDGQRSYASHIMQKGASTVGMTAIEDAQQQSLAEEHRFELKRKACDYELDLEKRRIEMKRMADLNDLEIAERRLNLSIEIYKYNFKHLDRFTKTVTILDPSWRSDKQLMAAAKNMICAAFATEPRLVTAQSAAPERVVARESAEISEVNAPEHATAPDSAEISEVVASGIATAPDSAEISEVVAPGIATAPDSAEISEVVAPGIATAPDSAEISEVVAPQSAIAADGAAAAPEVVVSQSAIASDGAAAERFESFSQEVREMLKTMELRLGKLSQDSVAKNSADASGAGAAAGAPPAARAPVKWRGKHCVHNKRAYRCKVCLKAKL